MSMRIWEPFGEIRRLENEINNLFRERDQDDSDFYALPVDLEENNDEYIITANLPGFSKDDLSIEATSQYIDMKAEKETSEEKKEDDYVIREIRRANFRRRITFDKPVNTKNANTSLKNGVLKIKMPKMEEAKATKLEISDTQQIEE